MKRLVKLLPKSFDISPDTFQLLLMMRFLIRSPAATGITCGTWPTSSVTLSSPKAAGGNSQEGTSTKVCSYGGQSVKPSDEIHLGSDVWGEREEDTSIHNQIGKSSPRFFSNKSRINLVTLAST